MKKKVLTLIFAAIVLALTSSCGKGTSTGTSEAAAETEKKSEIVYSNDYVDLATYKNLSVTKNVYTVTQQAIDDSIQETLSQYAEYPEVDRAAKEGDYVTVTFTGKVGDETVIDEFSEEPYDIIIGNAEYGEDFDKALIGSKAGDSLDFSVSYTEENANDENGLTDLAGQTVDYHVDVEIICEEVLPEYTDSFVKDTMEEGYNSKAEFEAGIKESLEEDAAYQSQAELESALIDEIVSNSKVHDYPDELYDSFYESTFANYQSFAEAFGQSTEKEDVLEMFGLTEEALKEEATDSLYYYLVINAIAENEKITVSDSEYEEGVNDLVSSEGYEDADSLIADYGEESIREYLLEVKVLNFLVENANITEQAAEYSAA